MSKLEKVSQHVNFSEPELLSKQDSAEVYKIVYNGDFAVLKILTEEFNYYREINSLAMLENGKMYSPKIYTALTSQEKDAHIPFYFIEEFLPGTILLEKFPQYSDEQKCKILYDCGCLLGSINTKMSEEELKASGLWKYAYDGVEAYSEYNWLEVYIKQIPGWIKNIREENDLDYVKIVDFIVCLLKKQDSTRNIGLVHRDYGFRNILVEDSTVTAIIDFEYAIVGDVLFDLSKIVFNDLSFECDRKLRDRFFEGWTSKTKIDVSIDDLWLYLAVQGLGAIQWVDKQKSAQVRMENQGYRDKGKEILSKALQEMGF